MSSTPRYEFQLSIVLAEAKKGASENKSFFMDNIYRFAILGGAERSFRKNGEKNLGDADLMSEFYQAKQFHNLIVSKELDIESITLYKMYEKKLPFEFTFAVRSLDLKSRFRFLKLVSKRARIIKPPSMDDEGETLNIKYSNPEIIYWYASNTGMSNEKL